MNPSRGLTENTRLFASGRPNTLKAVPTELLLLRVSSFVIVRPMRQLSKAMRDDDVWMYGYLPIPLIFITFAAASNSLCTTIVFTIAVAVSGWKFIVMRVEPPFAGMAPSCGETVKSLQDSTVKDTL